MAKTVFVASPYSHTAHCMCSLCAPLPLCLLLASCQPHCPGYRYLVELSMSLSPLFFLPPHSISFAGNRSWDVLIFIPTTSHLASGCFFHLHSEHSYRFFFSGHWKRINYTTYWFFISQIFIQEVHLTLKFSCNIQQMGIFQIQYVLQGVIWASLPRHLKDLRTWW